MSDGTELFLTKAGESLEGAESEFANGRYNNCANRCYYACFQAAVSALIEAGIKPRSGQAQWGHAFVQSQFVGELINRRKLYRSGLRQILAGTLAIRQTADYEFDQVNQREATSALRWARMFMEEVLKVSESR